jgi:hypothetical protein
VAPTPAEAPEPDAQLAETPTPAVTPDAETPAEVVEEERPEAAPEEATTEIVTEATETEAVASLAPTSSARPRSKPARAAAAPEPAAEAAEPAAAPAPVAENTEPAAATPQTDAVAEALAEALAAESNPAGTPAASGETAPAGPPLTSGEKDALRVAVQACWNVGSLSSEALQTTVTVGVTVAQSGVPDAGSIRMLGYEGGSDASAKQAYEAGRRAIIRCGASGFKLPVEKYDQWRDMEIVFNPEGMRMK